MPVVRRAGGAADQGCGPGGTAGVRAAAGEQVLRGACAGPGGGTGPGRGLAAGGRGPGPGLDWGQ